MDDLTRDLGLTKAKAETLSSRLKEWNLLASSCKISKPRNRHVIFANFYAMSSDSDHSSLRYRADIQGLFQRLVLPTQLRIGVYLLTVPSEA